VKDRLTGLQVGADDYLVKPFNRDEVIKRITALIDRSRVDRTRASRRCAWPPKPSCSIALPDADRGHGPRQLKEVLIEQSELGILFFDMSSSSRSRRSTAGRSSTSSSAGPAKPSAPRRASRFANPSWPQISSAAPASTLFETRGSDLKQESAFEVMANELRTRLIDVMRKHFPAMQQGQIGFFVGATRIDYKPQIRLERQVYQGMQIARTPCATPSSSASGSRPRAARHHPPQAHHHPLPAIVHARDLTVFGYEILTRGPAIRRSAIPTCSSRSPGRRS